MTLDGFERVAHLRPFPLPGGDRAIREPRRTALGLLYARFGDAAFARTDLASVQAFTAAELAVLRTMLKQGLHSPPTSSTGRLFDAVASLVGLRQTVAFEGQAAMALEFALPPTAASETYPFRLDEAVIDWAPLIDGVLRDMAALVPLPQIADRFHNAIADMILAVAHQVRESLVVLAGGCFQNAALLDARYAGYGMRGCTLLAPAGAIQRRRPRTGTGAGGRRLAREASIMAFEMTSRLGRVPPASFSSIRSCPLQAGAPGGTQFWQQVEQSRRAKRHPPARGKKG